MKLSSLTFAVALLAGSASLLSGCGDQPTHAQAPASSPAPAAQQARQPTRERLVERATERWERIVQTDWIQAYDFLSPEMKRATPLAQYLQGKQNHKYERPHVGEVLACEGGEGVVRTTSLWTPQHPKVRDVKLEPGQSLTQEVEVIESWRFADGDWTYVRAQRPEEFFQEHPEYLRSETKDGVKTADTQPAGK